LICISDKLADSITFVIACQERADNRSKPAPNCNLNV